LGGPVSQISSRCTFPLQPARRLHLIEVAVEVDLEHQRRVIAAPPCALRLDIEAERVQIQHVDERLDRAGRVVLVDVVVDARRQKRGLVAIQAFDKPLDASPRS